MNGPRRGHRLLERPVEALEHAAIRQLGQDCIDGIVEAKAPLLHEDQRRHRDDRLGHRGHAEDGVPLHGSAPAQRHAADRVHVGLAPAAHQRDQAGDAAMLDVAGHGVVHSAQSRL